MNTLKSVDSMIKGIFRDNEKAIQEDSQKIIEI
jgi:hypothetical protein